MELDKDGGNDSGQSLALVPRMDRTYDRAAKLIKCTPDVEGFMDVPHVQVLGNENSDHGRWACMMWVQVLELPPEG